MIESHKVAGNINPSVSIAFPASYHSCCVSASMVVVKTYWPLLMPTSFDLLYFVFYFPSKIIITMFSIKASEFDLSHIIAKA